MYAICLWQPWASLVAVEAKGIETRSWKAPDRAIGQRIAIHAGMNTSAMDLAETDPFLPRLTAAWQAGTLALVDKDLPRGYILATARLVRCIPTRPTFARALARTKPDEFAFGDYTPQRWAWVLRDVRRLPRPVKRPGRQGVFHVPDHLIAA